MNSFLNLLNSHVLQVHLRGWWSLDHGNEVVRQRELADTDCSSPVLKFMAPAEFTL